MEKDDVNAFVDDLCGIDLDCRTDIERMEEDYDCYITFCKEKVHALQYTYFLEIQFSNESRVLFIEIESGINNGTLVRSVKWDASTKNEKIKVNVLKDIRLDPRFYEGNSLVKKKAQAIITVHKEEILDFHRKNDYDNYVTGGNSKLKLRHPLCDLRLEYIYEEIEADRNFV